jgi:putative nucleotidyltransferase with HDIG domain
MREVYLNTIKALTAAIEAKDKYTMGHSQRVEEYSSYIAKEMHLPPDRMDVLRYAALLHDIGKIGITEYVLNKPDRLSEDEFDLIRQHPLIGYKILENVDFLKNAVQVILSHHERFDGKGYPNKISNDAIPLEAQIMSVADAYDAMTSDRPYRKAKTVDEAASEIENMSGTQFSPKVVEAFLKASKKGVMNS